MKRHRGLKILLVCLIIALILTAASAILLVFAGVKPDGDLKSIKQQAGRVIERNFGTGVKEIPDAEKGYFYSRLDGTGRQIYHAIYQGIAADRTEIEVPGNDLKLIEEVWQYIMADHPEFFWLTGGVKTVCEKPPLGQSYSMVSPEWTCSASEVDKRRAEVEKAVSGYLEKQDKNAGEYDRIKAAYDYIIDTTDYDDDDPDDQNIYSVFARKRSVCAGYSKAFQYLLKRQGISCLYVSGINEKKKEAHAWNIVQCGGRYYQVDVTWGDPVYSNAEDQLPKEKRIKSYDYLCCTDAEIKKTHTIDETLPVPACEYDDLNYYRNSGQYYDSYNRDQCRQVIYDDVDHQRSVSIFKFADHDLYDQAHKELCGNLLQEGARRILANKGMNRVYNYYQEEPDLNKVVIYWQYQ